MSFLKRAFGIQDTASRVSDGSRDTELIAVEEGRSVNANDSASEFLGAGSGGSIQPFRILRMPAERVPVDNHPLAPEPHAGEFPTLQSHTSQLAAKTVPTLTGVKRRDGRAHPYFSQGRKVRVVETTAGLTQRYKREVKVQLEADLRTEIEQELRRDMDKNRVMQEAQLKEGFEQKLMELLEKAVQEHKKAMADEKEQLLLKLDQAQQGTEAALKKADEATTETKRIVEMLRQTNIRAEKAEEVAAKATVHANEAISGRLQQLSLEMEKAKVATEAAMRRAEESAEETKKIAEKLEQANLRAERAEEAAANVTLQAEEALNGQSQQMSFEVEKAKMATEAAMRMESAEETKRMAEKLEQANLRAERAEEAAADVTLHADEAISGRLQQLSLEMEKAKVATEAAMRRAEESAEETKKIAEKLEQANLRAERAEEAAANVTLQAEEALNGQSQQMSFEVEKAKMATEAAMRRAEESAEETKRMAEKLEQANAHAKQVGNEMTTTAQQAEISATVAAKRTKTAETRNEASDVGIRADTTTPSIEMEVDGDEVDIYRDFYSNDPFDLNYRDSPGVSQVGGSMDGSVSSKIGNRINKGKGVSQMQDSDDERDVSSTLRQAQYIISSDDETDSVKTLRGRPTTSGPSTIDIDKQALGTRTKYAFNPTNVPPPQKFNRPKGGARPGLRAAVLDDDRSHPTAGQQANGNQQNAPSRRPKNLVNWSKAGPAQDRNEIDIGGDDSDAINMTPRNNPRRKKYFKKTPLRGFNSDRAQKLSSVRRTMNSLLGITKDDEVMNIELATREEVEAYAEGKEGVDLELQPMRPYFGSSGPTAWNSALCDLFLEYFATEQEMIFNEDEIEEIEGMFENRIQTLRKKRTEVTRLSEEGLQAKKAKSDKQSRANSRRDRKWDDRRQICIEQLDSSTNGAANPGWKATLKILNTAGPSIVSSDESGWEGTQRVYVIKKRKWRSVAVTRRMQNVDDDQNITNAYGGSRAGNAPRRRIRISDAPASTRTAVAGLPENCYSKSWVSNLDGRMQKALGMKPELDLGRV